MSSKDTRRNFKGIHLFDVLFQSIDENLQFSHR